MKCFRYFARRSTLTKRRTQLSESVTTRVEDRIAELSSSGATMGTILSEIHRAIDPVSDEIALLDRLILAKTTDSELKSQLSNLPAGLDRANLELELMRREGKRRPLRDFLSNLAVVVTLSLLAIMISALYIKHLHP